MQFGARLSLVAVVVALVSVACTSSGTDSTTSSVAAAPLATLDVSDSTEPELPTTTTTSTPKTVLSAPEYEIVERIEGDSGDTVIVLLDPETYDALTDIDIYDLIAEVVELFPPIAVVHVVDDAAAANILANPDASEEERQALVVNYLARLDGGVQIIYLGPFASSGTAVLGS